VLLCAANFARAQEPQPNPEVEYQKLCAEFDAAQEQYLEPGKLRQDPAQDPRKLFRPRFEQLAARAKASDTGCRSWAWVFSNSDDAPEALRRAFNALGGEYVQSPRLEEFVATLDWPAERPGHERAGALLEKILAENQKAEVRAAVLLTQTSGLVERGNGSESERALAHARLERLGKEFGETSYGLQAEGLLFELEHLQIGMVAPDFTALDQDGKPWKLSDYRGKVVVLDFWGYW
jgi:hypothetical protein